MDYEEKLKRRQRALEIDRKKGVPFTKAEKAAAGLLTEQKKGSGN